MDINCTSHCMHQKEGKCRLKEIHSETSQIIAGNETGCPYFKHKKRNPS